MGAEPLDIAQLDVLIAADHVGQGGDGDDRVPSVRGQFPNCRNDSPQILVDERPLGAPNRSVPERIQCAAAQAARRVQAAQRREGPGAEGELGIDTERAQ